MNKTNKAHKIRLKPNNKQKSYFAKACGISRFSYNWALAEWNKIYERDKIKSKEEREKLSGMHLKKKFNAIKKEEFPWTGEVTKYAAQQPFLDLQAAWNGFFKGTGGKPVFKKKGKSKDSFYIGGDKIKIEGMFVVIPKLGKVKMTEKIRFNGKINSCVISRRAGFWFASFQVEEELVEAKPSKTVDNGPIGIDLGINSVMTLSNGFQISNPRILKSKERRLKRAQRQLSKKMRIAKSEKRKLSDSKNYQKKKLKVAKLHYKISCIRSDIQHKLTSYLTKTFSSIAVEDLNVKGMVKNHNLAKALIDVGFGEIRRQIEYKSSWNGGNMVYVGRFFPSSKMCSSCGMIKKDLSLKDRIYSCECGNEVDRDLNAAINIRKHVPVGEVLAEFTPVEITAMQKQVHPAFVTSIADTGNKPQIGAN